MANPRNRECFQAVMLSWWQGNVTVHWLWVSPPVVVHS